MTIDVEDVATDADLEKYTLGQSNLQDLLPGEWFDVGLDKKVATIARQRILEEILETLARRRPPIYEVDITTPSELKTTLCYGALRMLYFGAVTHDDSPHAKRAKLYASLYASELNSLQPTVASGVMASSLSIRVSRG